MDNMLFKSLIIQLDVISYISDPIPLLLLYDIDIEEFFLTHHGPVVPYDVIELVNIGSDNGLLPDGTKPLPETMLTNHQRNLVEFTWNFTGNAQDIYVYHSFSFWWWSRTKPLYN